MKVVYASRTGNVETLIGKLGITDALHIEDGTEKVSEDYILFTYTDGFGDVPYEVSDFLENNPSIKGVIDLWRKTHTLACGMKATFHLINT